MSDAAIVVLAVLASLLAGAGLGYLLARLRAAQAMQQLQVELQAARVRLEAQQDAEARLRGAFDAIAGETLRANSDVFLRMAREALGRDQAVAQGAMKERELAIAALVEPLKAALERTEAQAQALERERRDAFATLRTQIEQLAGGQAQLQRETRSLVTALRRPEVRGRWGELTLRRVVELAGLAEHCDFTEQLQVVGDEGALRPDLVVHLPDERQLVVDAKATLDAYLDALDAPSEEERRAAMGRHAQQVESRVRQLASKSYWSQFEQAPEFTILFLPGDQFLAAALAERPELLENALRQSVIIATPSTLIALLKAVAYGWRQSAVAQNAATIRELGQELYRRLGNFAGHLSQLGQRLGGAVESYNSAVGSLERQVLPQARRFTELGVTSQAPLPPLEPIEQLVRRAGLVRGVEPPAAPAAPSPPSGDAPGAPAREA
jgi:DNA recombination protein RmuC